MRWCRSTGSATVRGVQGRSAIAYVLAGVGVVLLVVAVVYFTVAAPDLPSFVPGHVGHVLHARRYTKRGILALVLAVVAFAGAFYAFRKRPAA